MKNSFYECARRRYKQSSKANPNQINKLLEDYYKLNWFGLSVDKTDNELWEQYGLAPEEWLDTKEWT